MATILKPIMIKNPAILRRVHDALAEGRGRNPTESAENLILDGWDARHGDGRATESVTRDIGRANSKTKAIA